jgi:hypothetical protein
VNVGFVARRIAAGAAAAESVAAPPPAAVCCLAPPVPPTDGSLMTTPNLKSVEAKAFVPALDFAQSKRFYQGIGFTLVWSTPDLACFRHDKSSFLLQNFYVKELAQNFQMHLWVQDVDEWWKHVSTAAAPFGISVELPEDRPWGMRDFPLIDPSGVLWRIGQPVEEKA